MGVYGLTLGFKIRQMCCLENSWCVRAFIHLFFISKVLEELPAQTSYDVGLEVEKDTHQEQVRAVDPKNKSNFTACGIEHAV